MRALRITGKILLVLLAILGGLTIVLAVTVGLAVNHLTRLTAAPTPAQAVLIFDLGNGVIDSLPDSPLARVALERTVTLQDALRGLDAAAAPRLTRARSCVSASSMRARSPEAATLRRSCSQRSMPLSVSVTMASTRSPRRRTGTSARRKGARKAWSFGVSRRQRERSTIRLLPAALKPRVTPSAVASAARTARRRPPGGRTSKGAATVSMPRRESASATNSCFQRR